MGNASRPWMAVNCRPQRPMKAEAALKQTRSVKVKGQKERATEEYYIYGWKVLVLIDVSTRLPLAMKVVKIQEYEGRWLVPLLAQAQENLGMRGHISTIVIDRGYLDGEDLWQVHRQGI